MKARALGVIYFILYSFSVSAQRDYTELVNPFIGTGGHGHTYPGATLPFAMVQLSPDTRIDGSWDGCGGYHYSDSVIYGFSHTHLSGTGCSDYGDILLMPFVGKFEKTKKVKSTFSHANEKAGPGYYAVKLSESGVNVELTSTLRAGFHKYSFPKSSRANILLDLTHRDEVLSSEITFTDSLHIQGYRRSSAWSKDQLVYFALEFSKPFSGVSGVIDSILLDGKELQTTYHSKIIRVAFQFDTNDNEAVYVKVGISAVSEENARHNLEAEIPGWDFEKVEVDARAAWNKELSKIDVSGGTHEQQVTFYTALYHCMVVPNVYTDVDGRYRGMDKQVHTVEGYQHYTVFSLWDTFRALHPLMTIIDRKRTLDYIKTFLNQYEQGGLLPVWELSAYETECMIGYHAVPVILDAYVNGIRGFDEDKALQAMLKSAQTKSRFGLGAYMEHAGLDVNDQPESVSRTLEYSYDDWCIGKYASLQYKFDVSKKFYQRAQYWKNVFDPALHFMRPKKNSAWLSPFDPYQVNNHFTEANSWQYSFFVPQDIPGLISANGGPVKFEAQLDSLFTTHSTTSGRNQADITGMIGQYAHGNEPSHHMAYLYNYVGKPWKSQERIREILNGQYRTVPDGLSGNEDCGQMSAWFVLSALGIYSVTPGSGYMCLGTPLFSKAVIQLEDGKQFTILAPGVSSQNYYVASVSLNDEPYTENWIKHEFIRNGGTLSFQMVPVPEKTFGMNPPPATMPDDPEIYPLVTNPVFSDPGVTFTDSTRIEIKAGYGSKVFFTTDGTEPTAASTVYSNPIFIDNDTTIKAVAIKKGVSSAVATASFIRNKHPNWKVKLLSHYSSQYTAGGDHGIIDGVRGTVDWRTGCWQGYQGEDFIAIIDFGAVQKISEVGAGFLQDVSPWILFPKKVEFFTSNDGKHFSSVLKIFNTIPDTDGKPQIKDFSGKINPISSRYLKVVATTYGPLPSWHPGAGYDSHIFVDEIFVK
ncbi:MAG TPA: GH92 family glycosyl hydrolase [Bacteroidia bacterium]|nr:GH92 family glycosyl hydrolase [Bacteroidia bacterium]